MADNSALDWLRAQANQPNEPFDPIGNLKRNVQGALSTVAAVPGNIQRLVTDPSEYIKNLPAPTMEQMAGAFNPSHVGSGMAGVIKPKGGNWLNGNVEKALEGLKQSDLIKNVRYFHGPEFEKAREARIENLKQKGDEASLRIAQHLENNREADIPKGALNQWIDKNLTNYVKKEMGTPEDPVRKLAEQGITHMPANEIDFANTFLPKELGVKRMFAGFNPSDFGVSNTAKGWERIADEMLNVGTAGQHTRPLTPTEIRQGYQSTVTDNPWLTKLDPSTPVYYPENMDSMSRDLGFDHIMDVLKQDLESGRLRPESLKNVSMEQAVRRAYEYDQEMAKKMAEAQIKMTEGMPTVKEYPTGHKWIELAKPDLKELPEDYQIKYTSQNTPYLVDPNGNNIGYMQEGKEHKQSLDRLAENKLADALKYEGDTMGHCVGGYCPDVISGQSRIFSLRDSKGEPHVTIETEPSSFVFSDIRNAVGDDRANEMLDRGLDLQAMAKEIGFVPDKQNIVQIKGKQNKAPNEQYLPFVQDFVKSGNWGSVGDLQNTGLNKVGNQYLTTEELKPKVDEAKTFLDTHPAFETHRQADSDPNLLLHPEVPYALNEMKAVLNNPEEYDKDTLPSALNSVEKLRGIYGDAPQPPIDLGTVGGTPSMKKGGAVRKYAKGGEVTIDPPPVSDVSDITEDLSKPYFGNPHLQAQGQTALANAEQRSPLTLADPKTYAAIRTALSVPVNTANLLAGGVKAVGQSIPEAIRTGQAPAPLAEDIAAKYFKENPGMQPNTPMSQEYAEKIEDLMDKAHLPPVIGDLLFAGKANEAFAPVKTMAADYLRANPPSVGLAMKGVDKLEDVIKPEDRIQVKPAEEPAAKPSKTLSQAIQDKTNGIHTPSDIDEPPVGLIKSRVNHEDVGVQPEVLDQPVTIDMKKGDLTQHNLLTTREERETAQRTVLSQEEKDIIRDGAKASGVPISEIEAKVRKHKSDNPTVGDEPWAPLQVSRIVPNPKKAGDYDIEYKTVPYSFERDANDNLIKPNTPEYDTHTQTLAEKLKDEVRQIYDRFKGGDEAAGSIIRQAGWYKEMRSRLRQEFGGLGDTFADLLGATSPNTPVRENWKNAVDLLRKASAGEFDHLVPQWENWYDNLNTLEKKAQDIFDAKYAEGKTKKAIKEDPEFMDVMKQLKEAREFPDELLPLKDTGAKYGFNGQNAVRALLDLFRVVKNPNADIGIGATAPKAITFSGNLIGFKDRATIDVWAARLLQRLAGKIRVPSMAESGVNGAMLPDGTTTGQFGLGQDVFHKAVDMIRNDPEMSKLDVLKNISDDDLQALVWFKEKELWTKKNWTSSAGEGGSFEQEADLAGIKNQEEVNRLRKMIDTSVSVTKDVKDAAQQVLDHVEDLRTLKKVAKDDLTAQDMAEIDKQIKDLNEDRPKLKAILAKPTVEELKEIKKGAAQELSQMSRPLERFQAGISPQRPEFVPTNEDMASIGNDLKDAIHTDDNKASVMGSKVLSTEGRYGDPERSIDLEAVVRDGFNPNPLLKELVSKAQKYDQDSTFLSRVLRHDEAPDPLIHRPGVEIYFKDSKAVDKLQPMLDELAKEGINFYTVVVDGRRSNKAMQGFMPPAVGVRFQLVPEFEQRYGMFDWSKLTNEEIAAKVESEADQMDKLAARVAKAIPGVSDAQQFWYDTEVLFKNQYQEKLNAIENANRAPSGKNPQAGARVWSGQPIRSGVEAATRWSSEAGGEEANVQHGNDERPQEVKPEVNRIDMNFKDVTKRIPELTEAAKKVANGTMTREEYSDLVDKYKPITPFSFVPKPASVDEAMSALTANKKPMYGKTSEIPKGEVVDGRLDIPAYKDHGVWVNSVHRKGEPTVYGNVTYLKNGQMIPEPEKALKVAQGGPKAPFAVIRGEWEPIGEKPAIKMAQKALNSPDWVQAGYDPERHGFYYNRKTKEPITHFDESLQIGPLVLVKGAKNLSKPGEFKYKKGGAVHISNDRNTMWIDIQNRKFKGK